MKASFIIMWIVLAGMGKVICEDTEDDIKENRVSCFVYSLWYCKKPSPSPYFTKTLVNILINIIEKTC